MLEYIILGFLMHCDMSGYDIKQFMAYSTAHFYDASYGSIYPMLKKLQKDSLISVKETVEGGKYKKVYSINDSGKKAFMVWLNQPITLTRTREDHLVRMFFYSYLPKEKAVSLITDFILYLDETKNGLDLLKNKIQKEAGPFEMATLEFGQEYYDFAKEWCRRFLTKLVNEE